MLGYIWPADTSLGPGAPETCQRFYPTCSIMHVMGCFWLADFDKHDVIKKPVQGTNMVQEGRIKYPHASAVIANENVDVYQK